MPPKAKAVPAVIPGELSMDDKINHIFNTVNEIKATQGEHQVRVAKLEEDVVSLNREVLTLKTIVNSHEQLFRSAIIRISGFPLSEDEKKTRNSADLNTRVFERILSPILNVAASNGLLEAAPTINNTILSCYRIGNPAAAATATSPPPLVVKLRSSELRSCILRCKREAVFGPTAEEKEAGCKFFMIAEDLTQPSFKMLKELQSREEVHKAWSVEGKLLFTLVGGKTVNRVSSVFEGIGVILDNAKL